MVLLVLPPLDSAHNTQHTRTRTHTHDQHTLSSQSLPQCKRALLSPIKSASLHPILACMQLEDIHKEGTPFLIPRAGAPAATVPLHGGAEENTVKLKPDVWNSPNPQRLGHLPLVSKVQPQPCPASEGACGSTCPAHPYSTPPAIVHHPLHTPCRIIPAAFRLHQV